MTNLMFKSCCTSTNHWIIRGNGNKAHRWNMWMNHHGRYMDWGATRRHSYPAPSATQTMRMWWQTLLHLRIHSDHSFSLLFKAWDTQSWQTGIWESLKYWLFSKWVPKKGDGSNEKTKEPPNIGLQLYASCIPDKYYKNFITWLSGVRKLTSKISGSYRRGHLSLDQQKIIILTLFLCNICHTLPYHSPKNLP